MGTLVPRQGGDVGRPRSCCWRTTAGCNVISVSVKVYRDGTVGFAHSRTDDESCHYAWPFYRWSEDGGESWSRPRADGRHGDPVRLPVQRPPHGAFERPHGAAVPAQHAAPDDTRDVRALVHAAYSDDAGRTWKLSNPVAVRGTTADGIARRGADGAGRLRAEGRYDNVPHAHAVWGRYTPPSLSDGGETVSESYDTGLDSPAAPCSAARVPATGDVVLVWNNAKPDAPGSGKPRAPLTAAVSRDDGRTWGNFKDIEPDTSLTATCTP